MSCLDKPCQPQCLRLWVCQHRLDVLNDSEVRAAAILEGLKHKLVQANLEGLRVGDSVFTGEQAEQRRLGEEKELVQERELVKVPGKERKEILDLRKRAESATLNLLKTGILGSMKEVSPEEFKRMSDVMFKLMSPQGKLAKELGDEAISKATKKSSGGKASRANEIRKENPSLSREEIINMVNKEFTR